VAPNFYTSTLKRVKIEQGIASMHLWNGGVQMGNFKVRVEETVKILATSEGDIKVRLKHACHQQFILATPKLEPELPQHLVRQYHDIYSALTEKSNEYEDNISATLYRKHNKTVAKIAAEIWALYCSINNYDRTHYEESTHFCTK